MHRTARILCAALAAAAFACGGGGGGAGGGGGSTVGTAADALQHCTTYWNDYFDRQGSCASMAPALVTANKTSTVVTTCAQLSHEIGAGRARFDTAKGTACLAALRALDCTHFAIAANSETYAPCVGVVSGVVGDGATCYSGFDCVEGFCELGATGCSGSCVRLGRQGENCDNDCGSGLGCRDNSCQPLSQDGGPCPCEEGLRCDASGACRPQGTAGAACQGPDDCAFEFECASDKTCRRLAGTGETCDASQDATAVECGAGFYCDHSTAPARCAAEPALGAPCVAPADGTLTCVSGFCDVAGSQRCEALRAEGAGCTQQFECASGLCSAGHCAAACTAP
jgi:hypothetical protein